MPFCCLSAQQEITFLLRKVDFSSKGDVEMKVNFKKLQVLLMNSNKITFAIQQNCNDVKFYDASVPF